MSWNGAGVFNRLFSWTADKAAAINITASRVDSDTNDIVTQGLGNCVTRDGQGQPTANLPMATFRHTGVADGVSRTDYASVGQSQDGKLNWVAAGGSADALAATYIPALTALVDGQLCHVRAVGANATTTPTFAPNGLTARTITKIGGAALAVADINATGHEIILRYNLANTRWELLNPAAPIVYSNDAAAAVGPTLDIFRDSASPAVSDFIGSVDFNGRDSGAAKQLYAEIVAQITDPTAASEDAILILRAVVAGVLTDMLKTSAAGVTVPGTLDATGAFAVNTNKFTVAAASGNTLAAGTLDATGNFAVNTSKFTVASASGNTVSAGSILSSSASGGVGYSTGAGGQVTQATNKATGVTLNSLCGAITTNNAALAGNTTVSFTLTNSSIAATDVLAINISSGGSLGAYIIAGRCAAGSATILISNITGGSLSEVFVIQFAVIKGVNS